MRAPWNDLGRPVERARTAQRAPTRMQACTIPHTHIASFPLEGKWGGAVAMGGERAGYRFAHPAGGHEIATITLQTILQTQQGSERALSADTSACQSLASIGLHGLERTVLSSSKPPPCSEARCLEPVEIQQGGAAISPSQVVAGVCPMKHASTSPFYPPPTAPAGRHTRRRRTGVRSGQATKSTLPPPSRSRISCPCLAESMFDWCAYSREPTATELCIAAADETSRLQSKQSWQQRKKSKGLSVSRGCIRDTPFACRRCQVCDVH